MVRAVRDQQLDVSWTGELKSRRRQALFKDLNTNTQFKIIILYVILGLGAAPHLILSVKPTVLAPPPLRHLSSDWLSLSKTRFEQHLRGAPAANMIISAIFSL